MLRRVPALYATLFALLLSPAVAHAQIAESRTQPGRLEVTFTDRTATGAAGWLDVSKYGIVDHALSFTVFGAPSAVSVSLGCSNDGGLTSTSTVGTSTSTTGGTISTTALVCTHVRMVVNTLTGGTSPKIRGVYTGTGSGANATVSGDITATITGFATDAKQDTQTTELTAIKTATQAVSALITGGAIPVTGSFTSGGLTDTQLRATPVPVSGTIGISQTTTANDVDATITNSTLAVTQSGNWTARLADGSGNAIGSNANGGSTRGLAAVIYDGSGNVVSSFGGSGGTASAFGSAFPSGASSGTASGFYDGTNMQAARVFDLDSGGGTQYGLGINLRRAASGGSAELIGQATMANSLPVALASDQTALPITDNSGSLTIDAPVGTPAFVRLSDGSAAITTLAVSLATVPSHAVTNAGTFATQPAGSVAHDAVGTSVNPVLVGAYASAAAPTDVSADGDATRLWTLRSGALASQPTFAGILAVAGNGASSTGVQRVTIASDSTGVLANVATIGTSVTPGTAAANLGKAEDAAHASGDTGVVALVRRSDTAASSSTTDGDYSTLNTDSLGRLWTNPFPAAPAAGTYLPIRLSDGTSFYEPLTPYTHDTALGTITSVKGVEALCRASAAAPTSVSADDDAVLRWCLRNGSSVTNLAAGSTLITATSTSLNVNCTGGCSGGTQYAEDIAHTTGDSTIFVSGIRRDTTPSSSAGTAGDYTAFNIDANGRLYVNAALYDAAGAALTAAVDYTHDTALGTITSVTGPEDMCRASAAAPSDVSADNDAVIRWCLRNGAAVTNLAAGGTLITAGSGAASSALRVAIATDDPVSDAADLFTANLVASGATDAGSPLKVGFKATSSVSGLTNVTTGQRTDSIAGLDGVQITRPYANLEDRVSGVAAVTDGSSTSLVAAQGAGVRFCTTTIIVSNSSATNVTVDLRDGAAGSVLMTIPAAANMGGAVVNLPVPLCTTANTALAADPSASATTVTTTAVGFKTKL